MDIRNTRELKKCAARRIVDAPQEKKIVLIYGGLSLGLALLNMALRYVLGLQIDQLGGLSNMGTRTILSTIQSLLPLVQSLIAVCLEVGYVAAMLRVSRGQYASPNTLRLGFDRFWTLLRCCLIRGLIYSSLALAAVYASALIFVFSPFGASFLEQMSPLMADVSLLNPQLALDDATVAQLMPSMIPMFVIIAIVACLLVLPAYFHFRMVTYVIIDKPGKGAMFALRESRKMMKGNCLKLLKLDLSYWWYSLLLMAISSLGSLDLYLAAFGVELPMSPDAAYFVFYIISMALQLAAYYFLRNKVEVTYALVYNSIKPEEPKADGVVLGNIFQM